MFQSPRSSRPRPAASRWRAPLAPLLLAIGVACAPAAARGEGEAPVRVRLEGVSGASEKNVMALLGMAQAAQRGRYSEAEVRGMHARARQEIRRALEPFGYYRAAVRERLERDGKGWVATYAVEPGPAVRLDTVEVRVTGPGAQDPRFARAVREFPLAPGDVLLHARYEEGKRALPTAASETGYLDAHFEAARVRVELERYAASIHLAFDTGPRFRFGPVVFQQDVLDSSFLQSYVPFQRGQPFDIRQLLALQQRLGDSPYFERVEVQPRRDSASVAGGEVPIVVQMWPSRALKYTIGAGYGTDDGVRAVAGLELRRINRHAHRAATEGKISEIERSVSGQYVIPWPHVRSDLLAFSADYSHLEPRTSSAKTFRVGVSVGLGRGKWRETFSLTFERDRYTVGLDEGLSRLLMPEASWATVRADDRIDPRRGLRLSLRTRAAAERAGSDASFAQLETQGKWIAPLGGHGRSIVRLDLGYTRTTQFHQLPPLIRFFAGGAQSVRGYDYDGLGTLDAAGNVIGGESLVVGSVEYEHRLLPSWGVAVFYDSGNAMRSLRDPLKNGTGAGVRWVSPVGMVRVDAAWALSDPGTPVKFHLSIGPEL